MTQKKWFLISQILMIFYNYLSVSLIWNYGNFNAQVPNTPGPYSHWKEQKLIQIWVGKTVVELKKAVLPGIKLHGGWVKICLNCSLKRTDLNEGWIAQKLESSFLGVEFKVSCSTKDKVAQLYGGYTLIIFLFFP